jgi:hypothetical protein
MTSGAICWTTLGLFLALAAVACVHKIVVPVAIVVPVPILRWTLPLEADDDTPFCIAATTDPWVDPADGLPLRCVSVGSVRRWIRAQRLANE